VLQYIDSVFGICHVCQYIRERIKEIDVENLIPINTEKPEMFFEENS